MGRGGANTLAGQCKKRAGCGQAGGERRGGCKRERRKMTLRWAVGRVRGRE